MTQKIRLQFCGLVILLLSIVIIPTRALAHEKSEEVETLDVLVTVSDQPSNEDKDWPIVHTESYRTINPDGQEVTYTLIVRREPGTILTQFCNTSNDTEVSLSSASCTQQPSQSFTREVTSGGITSHVKHFATAFCSGTECLTRYWKPYRVEAWWTRTATSWTVSNAKHTWGCDSCLECPNGNSINQVYYGSSFTPSWQNSTNSHYYVYTSTQFKIMKFFFTSFPRSTVTSDVYNSGVKQESINNTVILPID